jgi:CMP-N,N'-diacetyllegionaminic acid synthase
MTLAAFVPARSGSKRVPGKNVKPLAGKPLVLWTLEAFAAAEQVDKVIFSTDSEQYWDLARKHLGEGKLILDWRSADEAGDKVKIFDYLQSAADKIFADRYDTFVMGLPTVPFRRAHHIDAAIALSKDHRRPVFSATEYGFPISFAFYRTDDGGWQSAGPNNPMDTGNTRSQDQKVAYHPNGAIYVRSVADLKDPTLKTLYRDALPYLMDRDSSVDIDNEADFTIASAMVTAGLVI